MADQPPVAGPAEAAPAAASVTAGELLRRAREAQGLHIAALAASLKIPQRKLEALERDRYEELPDASFVRALALTVCRALKIDAAPVLALLPRMDAGALDQVSGGLNTPFREHAGPGEPVMGSIARHPAAAVVLLLLVAALAIWLWPRAPVPVTAPETIVIPASPPGLAASEAAPDAADPAASVPADAASAAAAASAPAGEGAASAAASAPAVAVTPAATAGGNLLTVRARADTWVQVIDGTNTTLLSRTVPAGASASVDGKPPLRVTIGNAVATELSFRGQPVDLAPATRDNIVRLQLE